MSFTPLLKKTTLAFAMMAAAGLANTAFAKTFYWAYQDDAVSMDPMSLN